MNTSTSELQLGDIGQIGITVADLDKAVTFYRDVLRIKHLFSVPPNMAFFMCGNTRLMLSRPEKADGERFKAALYFKVPEIHGAHETLVARGVSFEARPHLLAKLTDHELWIAFFRDPDANLLALMCEKRG